MMITNSRGEVLILFLVITAILIASGVGVSWFVSCDPAVQHCLK